jgi:hypothetical protein
MALGTIEAIARQGNVRRVRQAVAELSRLGDHQRRYAQEFGFHTCGKDDPEGQAEPSS